MSDPRDSLAMYSEADLERFSLEHRIAELEAGIRKHRDEVQAKWGSVFLSAEDVALWALVEAKP